MEPSPAPQRVASTRHLIIFLAIVTVLALAGFQSSRHPAAASTGQGRLMTYVVLISLQLLFLRFVRAGVRKQGGSLRSLIGRTEGGRSLVIDFFLSGAFWGVTTLFSIALHRLLSQPDDHTTTLLPRGGVEIALWIVLAIVAGFSEEVVYRGYAQRQFAFLTRSRFGGVFLQGLLFGISHGYQGVRPVIIITILGLLFGALAEATRRLRPGMMAHAAIDILNGVFRS